MQLTQSKKFNTFISIISIINIKVIGLYLNKACANYENVTILKFKTKIVSFTK